MHFIPYNCSFHHWRNLTSNSHLYPSLHFILLAINLVWTISFHLIWCDFIMFIWLNLVDWWYCEHQEAKDEKHLYKLCVRWLNNLNNISISCIGNCSKLVTSTDFAKCVLEKWKLANKFVSVTSIFHDYYYEYEFRTKHNFHIDKEWSNNNKVTVKKMHKSFHKNDIIKIDKNKVLWSIW